MFKETLEIKLTEKGMTKGELVKKMGITPQQLSMKLNSNNFSEKDMMQIADALGLELKITLE